MYFSLGDGDAIRGDQLSLTSPLFSTGIDASEL